MPDEDDSGPNVHTLRLRDLERRRDEKRLDRRRCTKWREVRNVVFLDSGAIINQSYVYSAHIFRWVFGCHWVW